MFIFNRRSVRSLAAIAGLLTTSAAFADLTIVHLSTTLTQSIAGHSNAGYFHGPAGAFSTFSGSEQYLTPYLDPAGGNPTNPSDLNGSYPLQLSGMVIPPGNSSQPTALAGADVGAASNGPGFDIGAIAQSNAIASFTFASGDSTIAEADMKVISNLTYSVKMTVDTAPYNFRAEGGFGIFTDPADGNANTSITSATQTASSSMHIVIVDGGTTIYDYDDINNANFTMPDLTLGVGATITVTITATTESGFITTASREVLAGPTETVNVQRIGAATPFISIVPEPASLSMLAFSGAILLMRRRKS